MPVRKLQPQTLPRPLTDPRVRQVLAAFERVLSCAYRRENLSKFGDVLVDCFMQDVTLSILDAYKIPGGWSDDALRVVLTTWITNCPEAYMPTAVKAARHEAAAAVRYSREDFGE